MSTATKQNAPLRDVQAEAQRSERLRIDFAHRLAATFRIPDDCPIVTETAWRKEEETWLARWKEACTAHTKAVQDWTRESKTNGYSVPTIRPRLVFCVEHGEEFRSGLRREGISRKNLLRCFYDNGTIKQRLTSTTVVRKSIGMGGGRHGHGVDLSELHRRLDALEAENERLRTAN